MSGRDSGVEYRDCAYVKKKPTQGKMGMSTLEEIGWLRYAAHLGASSLGPVFGDLRFGVHWLVRKREKKKDCES